MPGQKEEQDFLVIGKLSSLLRENGDKILSGQSKFALTTQSVGMLSAAFRRLSDVEYSDGGMSTAWSMSPQNTAKWKDDVNFIRDFVSRCPSLKIIHGTNTMQGAIQVQRFRNLEILEMKKVPIHMIEGLHHLRNQLKTIIVSRSIQHLHDLFETCGSDMSSPMSWTQLTSVNLSFNAITRLDGSLRLLPGLQVLDLSHNNLEMTDNYLEYLTDLERINLGYNMLDTIPTFSISAKNKLRTLVLKNNNLDSIEGVEELVYLEELDLSSNCLSDHTSLQPLSSLVMLFQLKLSGNPITYHSNHRRMTLKYISTLALSTKLELDGKKVTPSELSNVKGESLTPVRRPSAIAHGVISDVSSRSVNVISREYTFDDSDNIATSLPVSSSRKKRKRSKLKMGSDRSDLESSTTEFDSPDTSAASSPRPDFIRAAMKKRQEIELFRNHYGPDWLRAMEEDQISTRQNDQLTSCTSDSDTNHQTSTKADTEQPMEIDSPKYEPTDDDLYLLETSGNHKKPSVLPVNGVSEELTENQVASSNGNETAAEVEKEESPEGIYKTTHEKNDFQRLESVRGEEWRRSEKEEAEFHGEESEPFIVMIENEDYKQMILVLNERYLIEKDLNGCVVDKFDLKCLKAFECKDVTVSHENVEDDVVLPQVLLNFDYIKKDRREKCYIMEDQNSVQMISDLLQPYLYAQDLKSASNSSYQCLKCSNQFLAKDGIQTVRSQMPTRGSSKDLQKLIDTGKVFYKCPKCGSELVILVQHEEISNTGSSSNSTPQGSYTGVSYLDTKYNSSSTKTSPLAKSTPVKNGTETSEQKEREESGKKNLFGVANSTSHVTAVAGKGDNLQDPVNEGRSRSNAFISQNSKTLQEHSEPLRTRSLNLPSETISAKRDIKKETPRARIPSESDITILHTASESGLGVTPTVSADALIHRLEEQLTIVENQDSAPSNASRGNVTVSGDDSAKEKTRKGEITPVGSPLSNNVCSDMVSSVYLSSVTAESSDLHPETEKVYTSDISVLADESEETTNDSSIYDTSARSVSSVEDDIQVVKQDYSREESVVCIAETEEEDSGSCKVFGVSESNSGMCGTENFKDIDHRLKLHLMMSLFDNSEEFQCIIETDVCQYLIPDEYLAYIVLSTEKYYVLKITSEDRSEPPASWLTCLDIQPVTELYHVDMGLGGQNVRLEFGTDCSCYTLIIRDEKRCNNFVNHLEGLLKSEMFEGYQLKTYFSREVIPFTMNELKKDVLTRKNGEEKILVSYLMGFLVRGMNPRYPVSFVITDEELILVKENHQWPQPRLQAPLDKDSIAKHFTVLEKHRITNIVTVEKFKQENKKLTLILLDEESGGETTWNVTMATKNGRELFIEGIRGPWEAEFGVDLDVMEGMIEEAG